MNKIPKNKTCRKFSILIAVMLAICTVAVLIGVAFQPLLSGENDGVKNTISQNSLTAQTDNPLEVVVINSSLDSYSNGEGYSYNSAYETSKSKIIVQIYTTSGALVESQIISLPSSGESSVNFTSLTSGTTYQVRIITPTYMCYSVTSFVDADNSYSPNNVFMLDYDGNQAIEIDVEGIKENSWITSFTS